MDKLTELVDLWADKGPLAVINSIDLPNDVTFGVEIECFHGPSGYMGFTSPQSEFCRCMRSKCKRTSYSSFAKRSHLPHGWKIVGDCSVPGTGEEVVSPALHGRSGAIQLRDVLYKLRRANYTTDTEECGSHTNIGIPVGFYLHKFREFWNEFDTNDFREKVPGGRLYTQSIWSGRGFGIAKSNTGVCHRGNRFEYRVWEGTLDYRQWLAQIHFGYEAMRLSQET